MNSQHETAKRWQGLIDIAPIFGLFGTIAGMSWGFWRLSTSASVRPADFAVSIIVAVACTVLGLLTAIPLLVFGEWYRFRRK